MMLLVAVVIFGIYRAVLGLLQFAKHDINANLELEARRLDESIIHF